MSKIVLGIISVWVAISICAACLFGFFLFYESETVSYDVEKWDTLQESCAHLPSVAQLGQYTDLKFKYLQKQYFIFESEAYTVKATYSGSEFEKMTQWIDDTYQFQNTVKNYRDEETEMPASFRLGDFAFRMLSLEAYDLYYPKELIFVGVSHNRNEIAFIYFYDFDLDYIDRSFADFLVEECGWES